VFITGSNATLTIIAFMVSLFIVLSGWLFSKLSKSSENLKRNVSFGLYIWGGFTTIFNAPRVWQIINGTFIEPEYSALDALGNMWGEREEAVTDYVGDAVSDFFYSTIEIFNTDVSFATLAGLASIGSGLLILAIGFLNKDKNWGKVAMLGGIITTVIGLSQLFF